VVGPIGRHSPGPPRRRYGGHETGVSLGDYSIAGVAEWRGELVAITGAGGVARSLDARRWEKVSATGFAPPERDVRGDGRDGEECAGDTVRGLAAANGLLVAVGQRAVPPEPGDDYCDDRLKLWRSNDATTWEPFAPSGLAETDRVDAVVSDATGFLAFGSARVPGREEGEPQGRGLTVWRSTDGVAWEVLPTEGLSKPGEYKYQSVNSVAGGATACSRQSAPSASTASTTMSSRSGVPTA
jgi:hypothetical protein